MVQHSIRKQTDGDCVFGLYNSIKPGHQMLKIYKARENRPWREDEHCRRDIHLSLYAHINRLICNI